VADPIRTGHNHPTSNPVIVVHYKYADMPLLGDEPDSNNPAHAFGPFINTDAARAFEEGREDDCNKVILDLYIDQGSVMLDPQRLAKALRLVERQRDEAEGNVWAGPETEWYDQYAADVGAAYDRLEGGEPH
jgi:hypothetical protein